MTDIVSEIWGRVWAGSIDLSTAEGRRDFDETLRDELRQIEDETVRAHAADMLKVLRWEVMRAANAEFRLKWGVAPGNGPREIHSLLSADEECGF